MRSARVTCRGASACEGRDANLGEFGPAMQRGSAQCLPRRVLRYSPHRYAEACAPVCPLASPAPAHGAAQDGLQRQLLRANTARGLSQPPAGDLRCGAGEPSTTQHDRWPARRSFAVRPARDGAARHECRRIRVHGPGHAYQRAVRRFALRPSPGGCAAVPAPRGR